jgi:NADH-quinone oxidoreductase subunit N
MAARMRVTAHAARRRAVHAGLFALLGIFVMISGNNFLVIYLGLELLTLSSYALVALRRDNATATEAAMKYFVLGAMASGFLLYGLSMLYGATGSLDINAVFKAVGSGQIKHQVLVFGLVFIVAGLAFKLGVVPFHMWIPDVYQGAPTAVTLMIGGAPKLAAFAIVIRLLVEGLLPLAIDWQQMLDGAGRWPRCWWATWRPSRRPTSSACWPTPPFRRWASCCWA